ncbi:MAG: ATP-binding cassette domain-containing protein, partial [Clostridia bacterium]|nr:ATP-binding cassette domain-containing protein [Clostridia bacterium]
MLTIEHLTKTYGDKTAVDDLSLKIEAGEICAFIGHNGAGKTTTLRSVAGILPFDAGRITVCGKDLVKEPIACKADMA